MSADLYLTASETVAMRPDEVFELFRSGSTDSWLFSAAGGQVEVGRPVVFALPASVTRLARQVQLIGRFAEVHPGRKVVIEHDQPWRGRIVVAFTPVEGGTRVRVTAQLADEGLRWLMRARGWPVREAPTGDVHRVGLLTSMSGTAAMFAVGCRNLATLAVEQLNADGGVRGRPFELLTADDGTNPQLGAAEARRLARAGCRVIIAAVTSATFTAVEDALRGQDVVVIQPLMNEGGRSAPHSFRLGERPRDQIESAARQMGEVAEGDWFLVGHSYSWSRGVNTAARRVLPRFGGRVVGESLTPLDGDGYGAVVDRVARSGATVVLSSLVGQDELLFERAVAQAGLRERLPTLSLALDEWMHDQMGTEAAEGLWGVAGYFTSLGVAPDTELRAAYHGRFGRFAPVLTTHSEAVFSTVHLWARCLAAGEPDLRDVLRELSHARFDGPRGTVRMRGHRVASQPLHVVRAEQRRLRLIAS